MNSTVTSRAPTRPPSSPARRATNSLMGCWSIALTGATPPESPKKSRPPSPRRGARVDVGVKVRLGARVFVVELRALPALVGPVVGLVSLGEPFALVPELVLAEHPGARLVPVAHPPGLVALLIDVVAEVLAAVRHGEIRSIQSDGYRAQRTVVEHSALIRPREGGEPRQPPDVRPQEISLAVSHRLRHLVFDIPALRRRESGFNPLVRVVHHVHG